MADTNATCSLERVSAPGFPTVLFGSRWDKTLLPDPPGARTAPFGRVGENGRDRGPDRRKRGREARRRKRLTSKQERELKGGSRPISRVLSRATIHLGRASPRASSDLPGSFREQRVRALWPACFPIWPCSRWGLPCRRMLPPTRCALTAPFHPYRRRIAAALGRFAFCCTFRGLAPPRRYLAPCSMEPGLSSAKNRSGCLADSRGQYTGPRRRPARYPRGAPSASARP